MGTIPIFPWFFPIAIFRSTWVQSADSLFLSGTSSTHFSDQPIRAIPQQEMVRREKKVTVTYFMSSIIMHSFKGLY